MIEESNLDVRTITLGISLLDCADGDLNKTCEKIYNKITTVAEDLVETGREIELKYGIPIVNKRISVTPAAIVGSACCKTPGRLCGDRKRRWIGRPRQWALISSAVFSALVSKNMTKSDRMLIEAIPRTLAETERVCSSVNVGSTKTGLNMDAVKLMGEKIVETALLTSDKDSLGCAQALLFSAMHRMIIRLWQGLSTE